MTSFKIFQIFYNEPTKLLLDPGLLPLDNTANERPDWYEFWVIRNFLRNNTLDENSWYGFLSPKFNKKTGIASKDIFAFLEIVKDQSDVALISYPWDQIAYFKNPFIQGDVWHPGIMDLSQKVFEHLGYKIDLTELVSHTVNFTFSNFIIAKPAYWREWLVMADRFYELVENQTSELAASLRSLTNYKNIASEAPMKTFIQERMPAIILAENKYRIAVFGNAAFPVSRLFTEDRFASGLLQTCDVLKQKYTQTGSQKYLDMFNEIRGFLSLRYHPSARE
jgi:hypothetical protein